MAGKPAARVGDPTAHGGTITGPGVPLVLIGGMPASVMGDMQVCPLVNPGVPPPPHVGQTVMATCTSVLIGGKPAARMGDQTICAGPPGTIVMGCPTVLIGDGGGGGGGGAGGSGEAVGSTSAAELEEIHYLDVKFVDKGGKPISGVEYEIKSPDGDISRAPLSGRIKKSGLKEGDYEIKLRAITKAAWSAKKARDGEKVKMQAEAGGFEDNVKCTFEVWQKDSNCSDQKIATFSDIKLSGGKVEAEWTYEYPEDEDAGQTEEKKHGYSAPKFYFTVLIDGVKGRSSLLDYKDWIEIDLKDEDGEAVPDEEYILTLPNGEVRKNKLDNNGHAREEKIPPGNCSVKFSGFAESGD